MRRHLVFCCLLAVPAVSGSDELPGALFELGAFDRFEASGVAYVAGRLAVVDDTLNSLFLFDAGGRWIGRLDSERFPAARAKFEDLAYHAETRSFFAVGSHEGWNDERLEEMSVLVEFRLERAGAIGARSVKTLPLRNAFAELGLWKPNGMKIEGLAIDGAGGTVYVGLREPSDRARIYALPLVPLRRGTPVVTAVYEFDAGRADDTPYCISALTWEPENAGLLIATSTEEEPGHRFLGNRLWFARDGAPPVLVWDRFDPGMKAEGLALGAGKLFIVYDNDQDDTGVPSRMRVVPAEAIRNAIEQRSLRATN